MKLHVKWPPVFLGGQIHYNTDFDNEENTILELLNFWDYQKSGIVKNTFFIYSIHILREN